MLTKLSEIDHTAIYEIQAGKHRSTGVSVTIPGTELEILQVRCARGMLFCGIFSSEVLEKLNVPAAVFSAPRLEDMLERKPVFLTEAAKAAGATEAMNGAELLMLFSA